MTGHWGNRIAWNNSKSTPRPSIKEEVVLEREKKNGGMGSEREIYLGRAG